MKKEKDEASQKRLQLIEEEIDRLNREYSDLEEIWTAEKAAVQGSAQLKEEIEKVRIEPWIVSASLDGTIRRWRLSGMFCMCTGASERLILGRWQSY